MLGWFKALTLARKLTVGLVAFTAIGVAGAAAGPGQSTAPSAPNPQPTTVKSENVQTKTVTDTKAIPFQSTTQNDSTLASGSSVVATAGVDGVETITYKVTYTNGVETNRTKTSDTITTQPITQVTKIGIYVAPAQNCPNGTYVNTAGNTVCSPYSAPSAPAGATAQCVDGTYSFSQSRSGTCSHHGGVAVWL